jgi:nucleotide-binding universal stress UspA family protein
MSTIVLATDGSPAALAATQQAIGLAEDTGARLVIVGVEHVSVPAYGYYGYGEVYNDLLTGEHVHTQRVLADAACAADEAGVPCETLDRNGDVVDAICDIAAQKEARLIVLGSHGWSSVRRFLFGSVSMGVLHHAPCPVLVVRANAQATSNGKVHADAAVV